MLCVHDRIRSYHRHRLNQARIVLLARPGPPRRVVRNDGRRGASLQQLYQGAQCKDQKYEVQNQNGV